MRALWETYVHGQEWALWYWSMWFAVFAAGYVLSGATSAVAWAIFYLVMFLLNLASWDYQRRQRAAQTGGAA
jgi:heme/copper-type cytochrome/quinol oxidase subunit 2